MSLDHALKLTFRNFSTLFLIAACLTMTAHLTYAFFYRDVISVADLHVFIERFPALRSVRGIGPEELSQARAVGVALAAIELALIPLVARAAGRALDVDSQGGVPGVLDSWRAAFTRNPTSNGRMSAVTRANGFVLVASGALLAIAVGFLAAGIGRLMAEPLPDALAWTGSGLVSGVARALAAPFIVVPMVLAFRTKAPTPRTPMR